MPRRHDGLFARVANFRALRRAALRAVKAKRGKPGAAAFMADLEGECLALERELATNAYRPGGYVEIEIWDPKHRIVSAAPFRDRVVHHAVMAVVEPLFEAGFIAHSFANRIGKGTHRAVAVYERYRDAHAHVLRCDIYRYFPAIDHAVLKQAFRRRISCARTLSLLDAIVDGSNAQEPVNLHFAGDDLFAPYERRRGLPIGNLTSQFFANLYLDPLDHFCTEVLRSSRPTADSAKRGRSSRPRADSAKENGVPYLRYVDDFALFHDDPNVLADWRDAIARFLEGRRLKLHPRKTVILPTSEATTFLGYELAPGHRRRLPEEGVARFRGRLRALRDKVRAGTMSEEEAYARIQAWEAHASFAQTRKLRNAVLGLKGPDGKRKPW